VRLLTDAAFQIPGIERVEIHHDKANVASSGVPRKLGFELVEEVPDESRARRARPASSACGDWIGRPGDPLAPDH